MGGKGWKEELLLIVGSTASRSELAGLRRCARVVHIEPSILKYARFLLLQAEALQAQLGMHQARTSVEILQRASAVTSSVSWPAEVPAMFSARENRGVHVEMVTIYLTTPLRTQDP
jgi:hypothetical protein